MIEVKPGDRVAMKNGDVAFVVPPKVRIITPASPKSVLAQVEAVIPRTALEREPELVIPEAHWIPCGDYDIETAGDERARLLTVVVINGVRLHLEAYAIAPTCEDGEQVVVDSDADEALGLILGHDGGPRRTLEIQGREYVLIATPEAA